ncbi:hypothetical protein PIB30_024610 [Stylosanthes scabra]|uniref:TF-B3 domain-containing protein n=1 Tax=Stylosanthes scabra TaxID=79078 RepID=A0ABU6VA23_9FABA|nr:hypothetical protein [Stylosanthes scabra]
MAVMADFRFFRFILAGDVNQLRLAAAFSAAARDSMANPVTLITTNGIEFRVEWIVEQERLNRIVLTRGWADFSRHYILQEAHLLLFSYHSPGTMYVAIHGGNRMEIDYGRYLQRGCRRGLPQIGNHVAHFHGIIGREDRRRPYNLVFPRRFATQFGAVLPDQLSMVTPTGWSRRVRWTRDTEGIIRLGMTGWPWMCLHYGLWPDTLVVFCYHPPATMYVVFYRPSAMEVNYLQHGDDITRSTCINNPRDTPARHMVDYFRSHQPFFVVPICFMRGSPNLLPNMPHLSGNDASAVIEVSHGSNTWRVAYARFAERGSGLLGRGWCTLATALDLRPGNLCVFEEVAPSRYQLHIY